MFEKFEDTTFENMGHLWALLLSGSGIRELPSSTGCLPSLKILNLAYCSIFEKFTDTIFENMGHLWALFLSGSGIRELPSSIGCLDSLEILELGGCEKLEKFPEIHGSMKSLTILTLDETPITELPIGIGCLGALEVLSIRYCSNLDKLPEFQRNIMGRLREIDATGAAIKELPNSICHLTNLRQLYLNGSDVKELPCSISHRLELQNCNNFASFPSVICELKSLEDCCLAGCSNIKAFLEITEGVEQFEGLDHGGAGIIELPSSIEHWKSLRVLELSNFENLETLPNSIGKLTNLESLLLHNCPKLHKLPADGLRSLNCCLKHLDISGCNLMEGAIPSDVWGLFSLVELNLSRNNNIHRIPVGIIHLSHLETLRMSHCHELKEIPELPWSLRRIEAHGCPCLETISSDSTHLFWSYLLHCFKSLVQDLCIKSFYMLHREMIDVVISGSSCGGNGIPEWVSHRSMGSDQIVIELPKKWYQDNNFLGFALFSHHIPLHGDDYSCTRLSSCLKLHISDGYRTHFVRRSYYERNCKQYISAGRLTDWGDCLRKRSNASFPNPALRVMYFPQIEIQREYRSNGWNKFAACFKGGSYVSGDKTTFKVESCGIHLIYRQHDTSTFQSQKNPSS